MEKRGGLEPDDAEAEPDQQRQFRSEPESGTCRFALTNRPA